MPFAIELARPEFGRCRWTDILGSLHDRFRLLTGGARTAVRRQQTLRASVDWSHALLTEPERVLFPSIGGVLRWLRPGRGSSRRRRRLRCERYQVLDQLTLLVDKSLVVAENTSGRTRYRLLETVRQYALEKLGESGEADDVRVRHREHFMVVADVLNYPGRPDIESVWNGLTSKSTIFARRSVGAWKTAKQRRRCGSHRRYFLCGRTAAETGRAWHG